MATRITEVDERDSCWEVHSAVYRVYVFDAARGGSHATATYTIADADVLEVIDWAQQQAGTDGLYAVVLISQDSDDADALRANRGLTWLARDALQHL